MPTTTVDVHTQLRTALRLSRHYMHQPECACFEYRAPNGEGYCCQDHARWSARIDYLLDALPWMT